MNIRDIGGPSPFLPPAQRSTQRPSGAPPEEVQSGNERGVPAGGRPLLTGEEKQFFESVFPEAKRDVRAFQAYTGRGMRPEGTTGTHVDRKA
jgi:hypothetical protein